jgi:toxin ParE1/3/4
MRCELSPQAEIDLREIGDYITRDNPQRAASFVGELLAHSQRIAEQPEAYPARRERVRIERIIHGSRAITEDSFDHEEQ